MLLLNAFSFNMIASYPTTVIASEVGLEEARELLAGGFESAVGHEDTARVFETELRLPVAWQRRNVSLSRGAGAIVGQYRGPRLPEGATQLPEGATIQWLLVTVE